MPVLETQSMNNKNYFRKLPLSFILKFFFVESAAEGSI